MVLRLSRVRLLSFLLPCCLSAVLAAQEPDIESEVPPPTAELAPAEDEQELDMLPLTTVLGELATGDEPVTTPTRTDAGIGRVGSATTVITEEQIRATEYSNVSEVLRGAVGLDVVEQGARGGLTSVFLRGANSAQTKVLLDGIPMNDPSSAARAFDFSTLSADNIERIEIVRGPQSTLYGTDAIGGVINIITKRGKGPPTFQGSFLGGSYGTNRDSAAVSGGTDKCYYSLGGTYMYIDGFSAASERNGNTEDDGYRLGSANGRFGWTPTEDFDIDYVFRWTDVRAEIDDASFFVGAPPVDDPTRLNLTEAFFTRVQGRWATLGGAVEQKLAFNYANYTRRDTDDWFPADFLGQTRTLDWQANLQVTDTNLATVGVDFLDEHASSSYGADASQYKYGVYFQDQIAVLERWYNTVGFRWDEWNTAGAAQTYQLRSVYEVFETGTSFHGTLGTGFRAPSLAENTPPFGNPDLKPEHSKGWDVGATQRLLDDVVVLEGYYFRNDFRDLIQYDPSVPPWGALVNIGRARTHGVELIGRWAVATDTTLNASYARTDTFNAETDLPLIRRPRDKGTVGVAYAFHENVGLINLYALFVGERLDSNDGSVRLDPYTLVNMMVHYQVTPAIRAFCRFDNLFNEHYEEVYGYATPGFSTFGGLDVVW